MIVMKATLNKTGKIILKTSAKLNNKLIRFSIKSVVTVVTISLKYFYFSLNCYPLPSLLLVSTLGSCFFRAKGPLVPCPKGRDKSLNLNQSLPSLPPLIDEDSGSISCDGN